MSRNGFLIINKPSGITSHDAVNRVRALTGEKRVGHAGTLDPFATGILIIGVGREATKHLVIFLNQNKEYIAKIRLGAISDTDDRTGFVQNSGDYKKISKIQIEQSIGKLLGEQDQIPPIFSAIKTRGKKAYEIARKNQIPDLKPRRINIYEIKLKKLKLPFLTLKTLVSSGTYIRSLARDLGKMLGTGALVEELQRTSIGNINIKKAIKLELLSNRNLNLYLISIENMLS